MIKIRFCVSFIENRNGVEVDAVASRCSLSLEAGRLAWRAAALPRRIETNESSSCQTVSRAAGSKVDGMACRRAGLGVARELLALNGALSLHARLSRGAQYATRTVAGARRGRGRLARIARLSGKG